MIHGGFRHLPVVDGETVVGMISIRDLVRLSVDDEAPRGA
jgi:CBS domain-containing protein